MEEEVEVVEDEEEYSSEEEGEIIGDVVEDAGAAATSVVHNFSLIAWCPKCHRKPCAQASADSEDEAQRWRHRCSGCGRPLEPSCVSYGCERCQKRRMIPAKLQLAAVRH